MLVLLAVALVCLPCAAHAKFIGPPEFQASVPPDRLAPREPWTIHVVVRDAHGGPVQGFPAQFSLVPREGGRAREVFAALPADEHGVASARVSFPTSGEWEVGMRDPISDRSHRVATVTVTEPGGGNMLGLAAGGVATLAAAIAAALLLRRRGCATRPE